MQTVRWGILGPGNIAHGFAKGIMQTEGSVLRAVASRDYGKALRFAEQFHAEIAYGTYEEILNDPEVDICYISVVHPYHADLAKLCLEHNKPILVEKPFAINGKQTGEIIEMARERGLLLMEAMWTRYSPAIQQVRHWIDEGRIGEPRLLQAQFGYDGGEDRSIRHLNRDLGGGALLDIGIYTLSMAGLVFGYEPDSIQHVVELDEITAVDRSFSALLRYGAGTAMLNASVVCEYKDEARVLGTEGQIDIPDPFYNPQEVILTRLDGTREVFGRDPMANGFNFEVAEAARCFREGLLESPWQTWAETQAWMDTMDQLRSAWGVTYPGEA